MNALRGESNVQGSTDQGVLAHLVPGYISIPRAGDHPTLAAYNEKETPKTSYWANKPKFFVSLLKAWWGIMPPRKINSPMTTCPRWRVRPNITG